MAKLIILGSSNATPVIGRENTHLAFMSDERFILVDCANNPIVHLKQAGLDVMQISDLVLTHFHPDHVGGVPSLLMNLWLLGRKTLLNVYGLAYTLDRVKSVMDAFDWQKWPGFFPIKFIALSGEGINDVLEDDVFMLKAAVVHHMIPTIGLRMENKQSGRSVAYSCDTEPCDAVVDLGKNVDLLVHEATGEGIGHSSPKQAGEIARAAGAKKLLLIHLRAEGDEIGQKIEEARNAFCGLVDVARDFQEIEL